MEKVLTISEVSRRSGVASSALRFYEDRGLIESHRAGSGHRRFARSVLRRVAFIVFAQRIGLSLDEIAEELSKLPTNRIPTSKDWSRLSSKWLKRIDEKINEMERLRPFSLKKIARLEILVEIPLQSVYLNNSLNCFNNLCVL